ncbi:hypothetical protein [Psychrobacillus sp. FJAT-21963]|uniref:hypothetical protein n=1 Tax=Psychrobacillus sp. FJAT-21963 TaxID=1712028 RepID=UPI000700D298|nr:hypothetical protein [Psychrobacillus sp. FJAT-21963]KQL35267.1 hypothetical protein AN959_10040 [Psychrobacillus sp. FJAT-21963]
MSVCNGCQKSFEESLLITTDHFRGEALVQYCDVCFLEGARDGFGDKSLQCECGEKMILDQDDEEVLSLAKDQEVIFYRCKKVVEARLAKNYDLVEQMEDEHEWVGLYVIQPEDDYE